MSPQLDLVFISDGEDSNMRECEERLAALKPPPCPSRLFSVGVRSGFPTTLVTDHLYPKFGRESDVSAPPVLPLVRGSPSLPLSLSVCLSVLPLTVAPLALAGEPRRDLACI